MKKKKIFLMSWYHWSFLSQAKTIKTWRDQKVCLIFIIIIIITITALQTNNSWNVRIIIRIGGRGWRRKREKVRFIWTIVSWVRNKKVREIVCCNRSWNHWKNEDRKDEFERGKVNDDEIVKDAVGQRFGKWWSE